MRLQSVHIQPYRLNLKSPLKTAFGSLNHRQGLVLVLGDEDGIVGLGDACPVPGYSKETLVQAKKDLQSFCDSSWKELSWESVDDVEGFCNGLHYCPSARNAIEQALLDTVSRAAQIPLSQFLSKDATSSVATGVLVRDAAQAEYFVARGFSVLKKKITSPDIKTEKTAIAEILQVVPDGVRLRLDANRTLTFDAALSLLADLDPGKIEFVEEPLLPELQASLATLRRKISVPIALDESLTDEAMLQRALVEEWADVAVIKPMMCGGPLNAVRYAKLASSHGVGCAFTSSLESVVGRLGALHVSAAVPNSLAAGLNTGVLFERDLAPEPELVSGQFIISSQPGIGISDMEGL